MSKWRKPGRVTPASLENAALHYLERFASSAENLRRVLARRVDRAARHHGDDAAAGMALVDELIARYQAAGLLDDRQYAEMKSRSMLRRGTSVKGIRQRLASRGVAAEVVEAAIADLGTEAEPDLTAALAYARRRRLGPFRPEEARAANRARDLAALGRAGFDWETARTVIDGDE